MPKKLFLIDGSNYAYRVQYALPPQHASDGFPTRTLYGFAQLFQKMMRNYQPDYCAVSFDAGRSFRNEIYAEYKANRKGMPEDMRRQWTWLPKLVEGFGYACKIPEGFEADDVISTLARRLASDDLHVYIVTGDKDFTQLVNDKIFLVDDAKGGQILDASAVVEKMGVAPERVIDLLALSGDTSDNIPGVPGIGQKTAAALLEQWGDLESILAAAARGEIKGKRGEMLVSHAEDARISRRLVAVRDDVPLELSLGDLSPKGVQEAPLRELFERWEFVDLATKLLPPKIAVDKSKYAVVTDDGSLEALLAMIRAAGRCGISLRTTAGRPEDVSLIGVGLALPEVVRYVPLTPRHDVRLDLAKARMLLFAMLADPLIRKVGYDLKGDLRVMRCLGGDLRGIDGDVMILDYVLVAHRRTHGLSELSKRYLGHSSAFAPETEPLMLKELADFAAEPAHLALLLEERLSRRFESGTRSVYEQIEMPLLPVIAAMEEAGIRVDLGVMERLSADFSAKLSQAEQHCYEILGRPFKIGSPKELGDILFEELGLAKGKKTKTGYSTDASVLEGLDHPLPRAVLAWRALQKLHSTYLKPLPALVGKDGRLRTVFQQAVAATGRLSSAEPNLQNIPVRTPEGRQIRDAFVAAEGCVLLCADYSQVELRVLAHFCGESPLAASFLKGEDIHTRTASEVWSRPMEEVTPAQRSAAKAINFGILYGMSAHRLSGELGISHEDAQKYMDDYFGRIPQVLLWIEASKERCRELGYVETLYGRRRLIPEIYSKDPGERAAAEREAVNAIVQGTAADIIKIAMVRVSRALAASRSRAKLILQVHDELLLEVPQQELAAIKDLVVREMMQAATLSVPLEVDASWGPDWNRAKGE